jgi:hypothetical protein
MVWPRRRQRLALGERDAREAEDEEGGESRQEELHVALHLNLLEVSLARRRLISPIAVTEEGGREQKS